MRTINKSTGPENYNQFVATLREHFGPYCAYCEGHMTVIQPQDKEHKLPHAGDNDPLKYDWFNVVLACRSCNSVKRQRYQSHITYLWPDIPWHGTGQFITVNSNGLHEVSPDCPVALQEAARNTISLFRLNEIPGGTDEPNNLRGIIEATNAHVRWFKFFLNDARPLEEKLPDYLAELRSKGYLSIWFAVLHTFTHPQITLDLKTMLAPLAVAQFPNTYSVAGQSWP